MENENKTSVENKNKNWRTWAFENPICTAWIVVAFLGTIDVACKAMGGAYRDNK